MSVNEIAIIVPYFGTMPSFTKLFFKTISYSHRIDFIFFTDWREKITDDMKLSNCRFYDYSLSEFSELCSNKMNINLDIVRPYKLCDLKTSYLDVFEEYVQNYKWVGWCDIDLLMGDIYSFLSDKLMNYDLITFTQGYVSGSFTIMRNTPRIRTLYKDSNKWEMVFLSPVSYAFDERLATDTPENIDGFTDCVHRAVKNGEIKAYFGNEIYEGHPQDVSFEEGKVVCDGKEYAYFHYITAKKWPFFVYPSWDTIPKQFYVNKYGFYLEKDKPVSSIDLIQNSFYRVQVKCALNKKWQTIVRLFKQGHVLKLVQAFFDHQKRVFMGM